MDVTNSVRKIEKIVLDKLPQKKEGLARAEKPANLEIKTEISPSRIEKIKEAVQPLEKTGESRPSAVSAPAVIKSKRAAEIDSILADGLNDVFLKMPPKTQAEFKKKGEETVVQIDNLLSRTRVKVNKIINLIRKWLQLIPGVNKFFLEQEAKIKADKIIGLKDK